MQGDKGSAATPEARDMSGMQLETDIPWSANAPYDPNERSAQEQNARPAEPSSDGSELVPYCVMPFVERLLKVCLLTSLTRSAMQSCWHSC